MEKDWFDARRESVVRLTLMHDDMMALAAAIDKCLAGASANAEPGSHISDLRRLRQVFYDYEHYVPNARVAIA